LESLPKLEELWAANNQLSSLDEIERQLSDKRELITVYFEGNPLQRRDEVHYRRKVKLVLPQVLQLDASE
jgi:protein phosphatase 1 regulatory subunit 7